TPSSIRLFHDHALLKMPGDSKPTPWHQDLPYWPMNEPGALSIWIALDDVDERNGCLSFIPRTRELGRLEAINLVEPQDIFRAIRRGDLLDQVQVARMEAGGVTFHDGLTFHYAGANQTDRPRHALAIIYMTDGTTYSGKKHVVTDGLGLAIGAPIDHPHFPVLAG
ncbi:MAG: phytanoyl-CoA dioxygenase family protein, partial [bacterium]|nr:phytanoyl-CoA dioxygenase family protein [bacterium]